MLRIFLVAAFALTVNGCATRGEQFPSDTSWIKVDETKKADVKTVLGEPFAVGYGSGKPTWTYGYYNYSLFSKSYTKELKFYWNRNGTVANFSFNSSFPDDVKGRQQSAQGGTQIDDE